jgi:hypothetical protein
MTTSPFRNTACFLLRWPPGTSSKEPPDPCPPDHTKRQPNSLWKKPKIKHLDQPAVPYHIQTARSAGLLPEEIIKNPDDFLMTSDVHNILE